MKLSESFNKYLFFPLLVAAFCGGSLCTFLALNASNSTRTQLGETSEIVAFSKVPEESSSISSPALRPATPKLINENVHRKLQGEDVTPKPEQPQPTNLEPKSLHGKRILVAIATYGSDNSLHLQEILNSLRDTCESGAYIHLLLYVTYPWAPHIVNLFNDRLTCRNPRGKIDTKIIVQSPQLKEHFVDAHRKYFYDNIDDFDLFVYTEDDMLIRNTHMIAYLQETEKLKNILGEEKAPYFGIGFTRYEKNKETGEYVLWEQKDKQFYPIEDEPSLQGKYARLRMPHQGMYMATREQLLKWKETCDFDQIDPENEEPVWLEKYGPSLHREFISSLRLFKSELSEKGCRVQQVIPLRSFQDFMLHHLSDRYHTIPFWTPYLMNSRAVQKATLDLMDDGDKGFGGKDGKYSGIRMEKDPISLNWESANDNQKKYITDVDRVMRRYHDYVDRGGVLGADA